MKNKKKVYILVLLTVLLGVSALVFFLTRAELPPNKAGVEKETTGVDMSESPGPPNIMLHFDSIDEMLQLRVALENGNESALATMREYRPSWRSLESLEDVRAFFAVMDNAYLPLNSNWLSLSYIPDYNRNYIDIMYAVGGISIDGRFDYTFRILRHEEWSQRQLETARQEWIDITDEVYGYVRQDATNNSALRVGNGIRIYKNPNVSEDDIRLSRTQFGLDVQGTFVEVLMFEISQETAFDIFANVEFARGVFAP